VPPLVAPGLQWLGEGGPEWPPPPGAPDQCFQQSGEPTLPPPVLPAEPRYLLVPDPGGSEQRRPSGRRGSLRPTPVPRWAEDLQLIPATQGAPPAFLPWARGSSSAGGGRGIHGAGRALFGAGVVLGASGVQGRSRKHHLKRVASIEALSPSAAIGAQAQYSCSEVTCHHDGLTHRAALRRSLLHLASRGHATCPRSLHLHMIL
jgi:hypothetical protein